MEIQNIIRFVFLVIISIFSSPAAGHFHQQKLDRIVALPGQPPVSFAQYSGYVTVNKAHGRALFYWLTEATSEPEKKPLVLWLNGGPGCSSVAYGASEEIGPFRINKTGASLYLNKFSWNKEANILFLESPAGVGFSYTNTSSDLDDTGDIRTAQDSLHFIRNWFLRFPQYRYRDFYVTGESYAGHYVPQLVKQIQDYNKAFSKPYINLKGFMVGNAVFDDNYDTVGSYTFLWSHAMISDKTYESIMTLCDFSSDNLSNSCNDALKSADVEEGGYIDYYSVYTPKCTTPANTRKRSMTRFKNGFLRPRGYDPCVSSYAEIYYNRPDVQKAMHANTTGIEYRWTGCSDALRRWNDSQFSMLPTYKELMVYGLRIWVFSGDVDSVVPVTSTRLSLKQLNLTVKTQWYPWNVSGQVGGWSEVYDGLTFVTIRGSGHEVPLYQPRRGLSLFRSFLAGKEMPAFE